MTFLLDTNVVTEVGKKDEDAHPAVLAWWDAMNGGGEDDWAVPAPVIAELADGVWRMKGQRSFTRLRADFDRYCNLHTEFFADWDAETARTWGELQHSAAVKRQPQALWDSLIDALAVRHGFTVATRNTNDFRHAETFNPWNFAPKEKQK